MMVIRERVLFIGTQFSNPYTDHVTKRVGEGWAYYLCHCILSHVTLLHPKSMNQEKSSVNDIEFSFLVMI
jgi:hypothetical protein